MDRCRFHNPGVDAKEGFLGVGVPSTSAPNPFTRNLAGVVNLEPVAAFLHEAGALP